MVKPADLQVCRIMAGAGGPLAAGNSRVLSGLLPVKGHSQRRFTMAARLRAPRMWASLQQKTAVRPQTWPDGLGGAAGQVGWWRYTCRITIWTNP